MEDRVHGFQGTPMEARGPGDGPRLLPGP